MALTIMDVNTFEFNNKSLSKKKESERRQWVNIHIILSKYTILKIVKNILSNKKSDLLFVKKYYLVACTYFQDLS